MADIDTDFPEDLIRQRSYLIWQREGCPHGNALEHWFRAKAELEAELHATATFNGQMRIGSPLRKPLTFVMPRVPISSPPCRSVAAKIVPERHAAGARA
ncbi:MAG: DUF2934 domain-containing protein [Rhizomicrobium sp.]